MSNYDKMLAQAQALFLDYDQEEMIRRWGLEHDGDDEFPANIKYLFDENALQYMHYETLWYVMGSLADRLAFYAKG